MPLDGAKIINPRTGTEFEMLELAERHVRMRYTLPPNMSEPDILVHQHACWDEEFIIHEGTGTYILGGETGTVQAGDRLSMPRGIKHVHPWNTGETVMVMEQIGTVDAPHPTAIKDTLGVIFSLYKAAADGTMALDKYGLPRNPIKFAATGRILAKGGSYDGRFPVWAQNAGAATLGRLAEAIGVNMIHPDFR